MQPQRCARGSAMEVRPAEQQYLQGFEASMKRESGLRVRPATTSS